jgi:hypothetical protein
MMQHLLDQLDIKWSRELFNELERETDWEDMSPIRALEHAILIDVQEFPKEDESLFVIKRPCKDRSPYETIYHYHFSTGLECYQAKVMFSEMSHIYLLAEGYMMVDHTFHVMGYRTGLTSMSKFLETLYQQKRGGMTMTTKQRFFEDIQATLPKYLRSFRDRQILGTQWSYKTRNDLFKLFSTKNLLQYIPYRLLLDFEAYVTHGVHPERWTPEHDFFLYNFLQEMEECEALMIQHPLPATLPKTSFIWQLPSRVGTALHRHLYLQLNTHEMTERVQLATPEDEVVAERFLEQCVRHQTEIEYDGTEVSLGSYKHKLCGQADLIARIRATGEACVLDYKRSGKLLTELFQYSDPKSQANKRVRTRIYQAKFEGPMAVLGLPLHLTYRVTEMGQSTKVFEYSLQLGGYRKMLILNQHLTTPFIYLILVHPLLEGDFKMIEIDLRLKLAEGMSMLEFIEMGFLVRTYHVQMGLTSEPTLMNDSDEDDLDD